MTTTVGTVDEFSCLDQFDRVLHPAEKVRYTKRSRKWLDWTVYELHSRKSKVEQPLAHMYSR
jgi:hypothetical protein